MLIEDIKSEKVLGKELWISGGGQPCRIEGDKIVFQVKSAMTVSYPVDEFINSDYAKEHKIYDNREESLQQGVKDYGTPERSNEE